MILILGTSLWSAVKPSEILLVDNKVSVLPISVDKNASKETMDAVNELASYIQKISGAKEWDSSKNNLSVSEKLTMA